MNPLEVLRKLGPGAELPPDAERRLRQRVLTAIAVTPLGITASAPLPRAALQNTSSGLHGAVWHSKPFAMAVSWLIGGGMGAALYGALQQPALPKSTDGVSAHSAPLAAAAPTQSSGAPAAPSTVAPDSAPTVLRPRGPSVSNAARAGSGLAHERALLDAARAKAAQGKPQEVLDQVERHQAEHPNGRLSEEREALAIQALLKLERLEEARVRARAFQERYPNSLMGVAIEAALVP